MKINLKEIATLVIGMSSETERNQHMSKLCARLQLKAQFIQSIACTPGFFGCSIGHLRALVHASDKKDFPLLVLENDCDVTRFFSPEITIPDDADIIYMGNSSCGGVPDQKHRGVRGCALVDAVEGTDEFYRVKNMAATHAILYVNEKAIKAAIKSITHSIAYSLALDVGYILDLQPKLQVYNFKFPIFYQSAKLQSNPDTGKLMQLITLNDVPVPREIGSKFSYKSQVYGPDTLVHLTLEKSKKFPGKQWVTRLEKLKSEA